MRTGRPKSKFENCYEPVTESGCWIWTAAYTGYDMYGYFSAEQMLAHRYSYIRTHGPIPDEIKVCHRCDIPLCVNPNHLFLGTNQDNMDDKVKKGRQLCGTRINTAKLTEADVLAIRASTDLCYVLADRYGVSDVTISYIKLRRTWKHVA